MDSSSRRTYLLSSRKIKANEITAHEWPDILQAIIMRAHSKLKYLGMAPFESNLTHLIVGPSTFSKPIIYEDNVSKKTLCLALGYADDFSECPRENDVGCRQVLFVSAKGEFMLWATNYQYVQLHSRSDICAWKGVASRVWKARGTQLTEWFKKRDGFSTLKLFKSIVDGDIKERLIRLEAMQHFAWELDEIIRKIEPESVEDTF